MPGWNSTHMVGNPTTLQVARQGGWNSNYLPYCLLCGCLIKKLKTLKFMCRPIQESDHLVVGDVTSPVQQLVISTNTFWCIPEKNCLRCSTTSPSILHKSAPLHQMAYFGFRQSTFFLSGFSFCFFAPIFLFILSDPLNLFSNQVCHSGKRGVGVECELSLSLSISNPRVRCAFGNVYLRKPFIPTFISGEALGNWEEYCSISWRIALKCIYHDLPSFFVELYSPFPHLTAQHITTAPRPTKVNGWKLTHHGWNSNHWLETQPLVGKPTTMWLEFWPPSQSISSNRSSI